MDKTTVRGIFEYDQSIMDLPRAGEALAALNSCEESRK